MCEFILARELDAETRAHVEQVQEKAFALDELIDEIEEHELSVSVEEASEQLEALVAFFAHHAMKMAHRTRTTKRVLSQDAYFVQLRHEQAQGEDSRKLARLEVESGRMCKRCGARMIIQMRKQDGHPFWSCSRFPQCTSSFDLSREELDTLS